MRARRLAAGLVTVVLGLAFWLAFGQEFVAPSLRGRVIDGSGRHVAGAMVSLNSTSSPQAILSMTADDGTYSFPHLSIGVDYELKADHQGLSSRMRPLRASSSGEKITIDLTLVANIQFDDVTSKAKLNFTLKNGATGHFYQPEIMLGGVAALDYNNDGCMDIFFVNGAAIPALVKSGPEFHNRLYRNNCDGTFTDVTENAGVAGEGYSMGVAAGDYNNDGFTDIYVTGVNRNILYRNRGDGSFEDVTSKARMSGADARYGKMWAISAGWFDYDNDGWLDLLVTNYVAWEPVTEPVCRAADQPFYCHPRIYKGLPNQLFHNNRDGTFTDVSEVSGIRRSTGKGMGVAFGDFDGDGLADVFVANDSVPNFLFRNMGNGGFKEVALESGVAYGFHGDAVAGMGADFRDFDDDGREDIVISTMYFETFSLFRNGGKPNYFLDNTISSGLAMATRALTGWGLGMYDFDNDGHKDLFLATSHFPGSEPYVHSDASIPNHVLRNLGNGVFEDVSRTAGGSFQSSALYHGAAFADFDNDGRVDVVVTAVNSPAKLYRNASPGPAHWIALRLIGTRSNRDGLGARVRLTLPTGRVEYNHATTSVGYASSSEPLIRFGLGPYDTAKDIEIRWPSGRVQALTSVKAGRVITVKEP